MMAPRTPTEHPESLERALQVPSYESPATREDSSRWFELLINALEERWFIVKVAVGTALLAAIVTLLMPNVYTAKTTVLPPRETQSLSFLLLGQSNPLMSLAGDAFSMKDPNDKFVSMLKGRTVTERIVQRLHLQQVYGNEELPLLRQEKSLDDAVKMLGERSDITAGNDSLITIKVDDRDPTRAAQLANAYAMELSRLSNSVLASEASQRRAYFEGQLKNARDTLEVAEADFRKTQEKTGLIDPTGQARMIVTRIGALQARIGVLEAQIHASKTFATANNPNIIRMEAELNSLRGQLARAQQGNIVGEGDIALPTGKLPEASLNYLEKYRKMKYNELLVELLTKQYELARLEEASTLSGVSVVDRAVPPLRKSSPKRGMIVIFAGVFGLVLGLSLVIARKSYAEAKQDPGFAAAVEKVRSLLGLPEGLRRRIGLQ